LKIFYEFDACTDYLKRLGVRIDTSIYGTTDRFNIYNEEYDKYFVGVYQAESPIITSNSTTTEANTTNNLPLFQETYLIEEETDFNSTGSTFRSDMNEMNDNINTPLLVFIIQQI
jgi:hypothetical protein